MSRTPIVAGNWKMNLSRSDSIALANAVVEGVKHLNGVEVAVFPSVLWTDAVSRELKPSSVIVGAQDCFTVGSGAFTGEISPEGAASICTAALAGHSERRHILGESSDFVGKKLRAILDFGMTGYLCVGETIDERRQGETQSVVASQLEAGLANVQRDELSALVIAYEPVWAIGTGEAATKDDAQDMCQYVRAWMSKRYGSAGETVRVLYGGSVSADNADSYFTQPDIDGALVGGASLDAESFCRIARIASDVAV